MALELITMQRAPDGQPCKWFFDIDNQDRTRAVVCDNLSSFTGHGELIDNTTGAPVDLLGNGTTVYDFPPNSTRGGQVLTITLPPGRVNSFRDASGGLAGFGTHFWIP